MGRARPCPRRGRREIRKPHYLYSVVIIEQTRTLTPNRYKLPIYAHTKAHPKSEMRRDRSRDQGTSSRPKNCASLPEGRIQGANQGGEKPSGSLQEKASEVILATLVANLTLVRVPGFGHSSRLQDASMSVGMLIPSGFRGVVGGNFGRAHSNPAHAPDPDHDLSVPTSPPERIRSRFGRLKALSRSKGRIMIKSGRPNDVRRDHTPRRASNARCGPPISRCSRSDW